MIIKWVACLTIKRTQRERGVGRQWERRTRVGANEEASKGTGQQGPSIMDLQGMSSDRGPNLFESMDTGPGKPWRVEVRRGELRRVKESRGESHGLFGVTSSCSAAEAGRCLRKCAT